MRRATDEKQPAIHDPYLGPSWVADGGVLVTDAGPAALLSKRRRISAIGHYAQRHRGLLLTCFGAGIALLGVAWIVITGLMARAELDSLRSELRELRAHATSGDLATLRREAAAILQHAERAHALTAGPAWSLVAALPGVGDPFRSIRGITAAANDLAQSTLPDLVKLTDLIDPHRLRKPDGSVDVTAIQRASPVVTQALDTATRVQSQIGALPGSTWLGSVDRGRAQLQSQLNGLVATLAEVDRAVRVVPQMLGADGSRRYFVGFLNESELRGTGGLPGAFAIVVADHGKLTMTHVASDDVLSSVSAGLDLGADFDALYRGGDPANTYVNSTMSPNFPSVARIWAAMWQRKSGEHIDGAVALDPTALSYLLAVTGPARLPDSTLVTAANVVGLTQKDLYARFPTVIAARKAYLQSIATAAANKILASGGSTKKLIDAASHASGERRLVVWSSDAGIEAVLQQTSLAGEITTNPYPYTGDVVINAGANKLDYYLSRTLTYASTGCAAPRPVTVTITLSNNAPRTGLPTYVTGQQDHAGYVMRPGDNLVLLQYYATLDSTLTSATVDGHVIRPSQFREQGHPVYVTEIELPAGRTRTLTMHFAENGPDAPVTVLDQPSVIAQRVIVRTTC